MSIVCWFRPHRWLWHVNAGEIGLYQCTRCKVISIGAPRFPDLGEIARMPMVLPTEPPPKGSGQ